MSFTDNIKNMFKEGAENNLVPSMPMSMAQPLDGTKVRFWTIVTMNAENAKTTMENSIVGEFSEGYFMNDSDNWADEEVFSWTKLEE